MRSEPLFVVLLFLCLLEVALTVTLFLHVLPPDALLGVDLATAVDPETGFALTAQLASDLFVAAGATLAAAFVALVAANRVPRAVALGWTLVTALGPLATVLLRARLVYTPR